MTQVAPAALSDHSFLDLSSFRKSYVTTSRGDQMKFFVEGVKCSRCVQKIESLAKDHQGLQSLRFNMATHQLEVCIQPTETTFSAVAEKIEKMGFRVTPIKTSEDLVHLTQRADRRDLRRLGVAAICASNIMMFSFATYFGASGDYEKLFQWMSFVLYLPVLSYVALPFYQGFWQALKDRRLSVDGPLAIASVSGFVFSVVNLIRGMGSVYFDSLSGFLFLILLSRFFQRRMQRSFLSYRGTIPLDSFSRARRVAGGGFVWTPADELKPGDQVFVQAMEPLPVDGVVLSDVISVDASFLTGESHPLIKHKGMAIEAGTILLSKECLVEVRATGEQTQFGHLLRKVLEGSAEKTKIQNDSDRWSQVLLVVVFSLAIAYIGLMGPGNMAVALERALALIILACPCAMAFGTPLALSFSMRRAFQKGFLIKSPDVFEKLLQVKNVFFDKTGTLTGRSLRVSGASPEKISMTDAGLVLALESISKHPIAEALRSYLSPRAFTLAALEQAKEIPGEGVVANFQGSTYSVRSSQGLTGKKSVALFQNGEPRVHFFLEDPVLESSKDLVKNLLARHYSVFIISGDAKAEVELVASQLSLPSAQCRGGLSAQDKSDIIEATAQTLMIGDGVNDSLAFRKAGVGIAVGGSVELALRSSDIYLLSEDVSRITELFDISRRALVLIRRNLLISLVYNSVGGVAALMGFVNPFVAALLMPLSSGFILLSSWHGSRR